MLFSVSVSADKPFFILIRNQKKVNSFRQNRSQFSYHVYIYLQSIHAHSQNKFRPWCDSDALDSYVDTLKSSFLHSNLVKDNLFDIEIHLG